MMHQTQWMIAQQLLAFQMNSAANQIQLLLEQETNTPGCLTQTIHLKIMDKMYNKRCRSWLLVRFRERLMDLGIEQQQLCEQ